MKYRQVGEHAFIQSPLLPAELLESNPTPEEVIEYGHKMLQQGDFEAWQFVVSRMFRSMIRSYGLVEAGRMIEEAAHAVHAQYRKGPNRVDPTL